MNYSCILICIILTSCTQTSVLKQSQEPSSLYQIRQIKSPLLSIHIVDRNGLSETISTKERIKNFERYDFLASQPYQKVLRVFRRDRTGKNSSIITTYYANGQIKQYLEAENGRAKGVYREWHENGEKKLEAYVIAGVADVDEKALVSFSFDGESKVWDEEGSCVAQIFYQKGALHGTSLFFNKDGYLIEKIPYNQGEISGVLRKFSSDGEIIEETHYIKGKKDGQSKGYWSKDMPAWIETWKNGLLISGIYSSQEENTICTIENGVGIRCIFDENGPIEFHEYKNGVQEGKVTLVEDSEVVTFFFTKDNQKHGTEVRFWPRRKGKEATPKLSIDWHEGKIQGFVKTWYANGVQESQKQMSNNTKHGVYTAWYMNGSLMMMEEYEKDQLKRGEYFKMDSLKPSSRVIDGKGIATLYDAEGNFVREVHYLEGKPVDDE